jgi:hypothetical protein
MKTTLAIAVFISLMAVDAHSQVICNPLWTYVKEAFKYTWNGECCDVEVEACIKGMPNPTIEIKSVRVIGDCWGVVNPATFPYNQIAILGYEKIVLRRTAGLGIGTIPQCPTVLNYTIKTVIGSCGTYIVSQEPRGNPDGSQSLVTVRTYFPCAEVLCSQECTVCVMSSVDPCIPSENRLFWTCESQVSPPACPATGCTIPMCSGMP